jgi:hypothetical protein
MRSEHLLHSREEVEEAGGLGLSNFRREGFSEILLPVLNKALYLLIREFLHGKHTNTSFCDLTSLKSYGKVASDGSRCTLTHGGEMPKKEQAHTQSSEDDPEDLVPVIAAMIRPRVGQDPASIARVRADLAVRDTRIWNVIEKELQGNK